MDVPAAAAELLDMRHTHRIEPDLPDHLRPADLVTAYAIQAAVVEGLGGGTIGYKCACTSPIAQEALRIDRPLFGRLRAASTSASGATLTAADFVHRVVEAEFAFRIGADVEPVEGGHTHASIAGYIDAAMPAIEIVDYRYENWTLGALQVAADNAIHGWWVQGAPVTDWQHIDLGAARVTVERDGRPVTDGSGANVLGHPLTVMAWLADELPRFGLALRAGDLVTTGVTTDVFEAEPGDSIVARFDGLGDVGVRFS
jgi:2-keto-4-pentenoate hydratase